LIHDAPSVRATDECRRMDGACTCTADVKDHDPSNPVGGYYGLRKGYRGRFANCVTPVMECLGLVALEHGPRNNRARSVAGR